jgi:hypothetical protein
MNLNEYYQRTISKLADNQVADDATYLKEKLQDRMVKFYINVSFARTRTYRNIAQVWKDISDRNKFIMNISDEELTEYIKNS